MATKPAPDIDDELFNEVYGKVYTGPPGSTSGSAQEKEKVNKRPIGSDQSDDEEEARDPNAVPTDFTSREAKVWEAKAKATERNWKKRKEEEMICKICGESGHFTQGCPSTLGANRKSADFFERVAARDKNVRALFTEKVISWIEKDVGCKLKMDEKFLIVSGKDRLILAKGVDAVHKVIQEKDKDKRKTFTRSKSPDGSPVVSHLRRSESQRSQPSPRNASHFQHKDFNQERLVEDHLREDLRKVSRGSPQAYGNEGVKRRPAHSRSPPRSNFAGDAFNSYGGNNRNVGMHKTDNWGSDRRGTDIHSGRTSDFAPQPQTLEELEMEFKREAMEYGRIRDKEEDEENYKHRECIRDLRENYMKKLAIMRGMHAKQWEEFLQLDVQRRLLARQQVSASSYNAYSQPGFADFEQASGNSQYAVSGLTMDSRNRYQYPGENYPASRPREAYGDFSRQRHEDFGKAFGRY